MMISTRFPIWKPIWPIRPTDEIYNAKPQKRGRESMVSNAKPDVRCTTMQGCLLLSSQYCSPGISLERMHSLDLSRGCRSLPGHTHGQNGLHPPSRDQWQESFAVLAL